MNAITTRLRRATPSVEAPATPSVEEGVARLETTAPETNPSVEEGLARLETTGTVPTETTGSLRRNLGVKGVAAAALLALVGLFTGHTLASWVDGAVGNDILANTGRLDLEPVSKVEVQCRIEALTNHTDPELCVETATEPEYLWTAVCNTGANSFHYAPCPTGDSISEDIFDAVTQAHPSTDPDQHVFLEFSDALTFISPWRVNIKGQNIAAHLSVPDFIDDDEFVNSVVGGDPLHWAMRTSAIGNLENLLLGSLDNTTQDMLLTEANDGDILVLYVALGGFGTPVKDELGVTRVTYDWAAIEACSDGGWADPCTYTLDTPNFQMRQALEDKVFSLNLRPVLEQVRNVAVVTP